MFDPAAMKKKKVRKSVVFEGVENGNGENGEIGGEDKATAESHSMSMFFSSCYLHWWSTPARLVRAGRLTAWN